MTERERQRVDAAADLREEAVLPTLAPAVGIDRAEDRRSARGLVAATLVGVFLWSGGLELAGWQILADAAAPHAPPVDWIALLRGLGDTASGAIGVGAGAGLATLLVPSTWKRPWRRIAVGFFGGACAFLAFLSVLTLSYFL